VGFFLQKINTLKACKKNGELWPEIELALDVVEHQI
jgi:hypothetical protein